MKRSDALAPLSRDHHHGLFAAQKLKNATTQNAAAARDEFLAFWEADLVGHFRLEEEVLLPAWARYGAADHAAVIKVLVEHVELRRMAADVERDPTVAVETLQEIGQTLHDHIRHEERVLFPLIEATLPEDELERLLGAFGHASDAAR